MIKKLGIVFLSLWMTILIAHAQSFKPKRLRLVDWQDQNLLFRGNMPVFNSGEENAHFAHNTEGENIGLIDQIKKQIADAQANGKKVIFPENYYLYDISLVTSLNPKEAPDLEVERDFFIENPNIGTLSNKPLAMKPLKIKIHHIILNTSFHSIDHVVKQVRQALNETDSVPHIIYLHCEAGCDRTGQVIAGYWMTHSDSSKTLTPHEARKDSMIACNRSPNSSSRLLIYDYCKKHALKEKNTCWNAWKPW